MAAEVPGQPPDISAGIMQAMSLDARPDVRRLVISLEYQLSYCLDRLRLADEAAHALLRKVAELEQRHDHDLDVLRARVTDRDRAIEELSRRVMAGFSGPGVAGGSHGSPF